MHEMYSRMPTYPLSVYPWTTLKSIESFLKRKAPNLNEMFEYSEPHLQHSYSSHEEGKEGSAVKTGESARAEDLLESEDNEAEDVAQMMPEERLLMMGAEQEEDQPPTFVHVSSGAVTSSKIKPVQVLTKAQSLSFEPPKTKFSFRFYYNGYEIINKAEALIDLIKKYPNVFNKPFITTFIENSRSST